MRLANRDLELLQDAALSLHEPRELEGLREAAPRIFTSAIPAERFLWVESDDHGLTASEDVVIWEYPARTSRSLFQKLFSMADQHPFSRHFVSTGDLGPLRLSDFWDRRQQLASAHHRLVYRHLGIGWMLGVATVRGPRGGSLNLARPFRQRDFSERDRTILRLLVPHFLMALGASEALTLRGRAEAESLRVLGLTPREREVAMWLARGRTNHEIAAILSARPRTVEKHVEKILLKLAVENRTTAARVILGATAGQRSGPADPARTRTTIRRVVRPRPSRRTR